MCAIGATSSNLTRIRGFVRVSGRRPDLCAVQVMQREPARASIVSEVTGDRIELDQSAVRSVDGERVELRQTAAQSVRGESLQVSDSAVGTLRASDVTMDDCVTLGVVGEHVRMRNSGAVLLVARKVEGDVRTVITPAAAFAGILGLTVGIGILRLLRRR